MKLETRKIPWDSKSITGEDHDALEEYLKKVVVSIRNIVASIVNIVNLNSDFTATQSGITASTTQTQGEGPLNHNINEISTVAVANDTVTLPAAGAGRRVTIINNGANTLQIFPALDDNLGAGVDTAATLAAGSNVEYVAYDDTNWESV